MRSFTGIAQPKNKDDEVDLSIYKGNLAELNPSLMKVNTQELCGAKTRRGYNQTTASGHAFWSADPHEEDIFIEDIAAQLARLCRYGGALKDDIEIYSVAQHSVLVSYHVPEELAFEGLMHDAAEAYVGDMIKPIKSIHPGRKEIENKIDRVIRAKYGLPLEESPLVKKADYEAALTEHRDLQVVTGEVDWGNAQLLPWDETIVPVLPSVARKMFMERFEELYNG